MTMYGYARVSSKDQNLNRQLDALSAVGVSEESVFVDHLSGRNFDRPGYRSLVERLQPGDVLVVKSIDRLGRNYDEILGQWRLLTKQRSIDIVVLDMPLLDTRSTSGHGVTGKLIADIVLELLSYVAHVERDNIRQRQAGGDRGGACAWRQAGTPGAGRARRVRCGAPHVGRRLFEQPTSGGIAGGFAYDVLEVGEAAARGRHNLAQIDAFIARIVSFANTDFGCWQII